MATRPAAGRAAADATEGVSHPIRVLVADDYAPMRLGVCAMLREHGFDVCAEAVDAASAVEAALRERPDVCVLDIHMPGDGVAAVKEITAALPDTPVVMLTVSHEDSDFCRAMRAGAAAYVLKDADSEGLSLALHGVLRGEATVPSSFVSRLVGELRERDVREEVLSERGIVLTAREEEVLELLCGGRRTTEIAKQLFVSSVTIRTHICSILKKLGVPDREAAIRLVRGEAWVPRDEPAPRDEQPARL